MLFWIFLNIPASRDVRGRWIIIHFRKKSKNFSGILQDPFVLFFSNRWSELHMSSNRIDRFIRDQKIVEERTRCFFCPFQRRSKNKEIVNIFKIITYLQNTVSIHQIREGEVMDDESPTSANLGNDHEFIIKEYSLHCYEAFSGSPKQSHGSLYSKSTISYHCGESCS